MLMFIIASAFGLLYAILLGYYQKRWKANHVFENAVVPQTNVFLSVVVAARNEEANIAELLNALSSQTLSKDRFEVIVVDDYSTDATAAIVRNHHLPNKKLVTPLASAEQSSKKRAIEAGIREARGELIVTTDADCIPAHTWLETICAFYQASQASFIAAPVRFQFTTKVLDRFQACDFLMLQGITATQVHDMCNGANLAYRKADFIAVDGFEGIDQVATGDDMLLMHKIRKQQSGKILYLKSHHAIVDTEPMPTWRTFIMQRKRWASKTMVYDEKKIILTLGFVYLLNCLCLVLLVTGFFNHRHWWALLVLLVMKTAGELFFIAPVARFFGQTKLLPWFVLLQLPHILYTVGVGFISQFGRYEWKGRTTK